MVHSGGGERSVERERMRRVPAAPASLHQTYSRVQFLFFEVPFSEAHQVRSPVFRPHLQPRIVGKR